MADKLRVLQIVSWPEVEIHDIVSLKILHMLIMHSVLGIQQM